MEKAICPSVGAPARSLCSPSPRPAHRKRLLMALTNPNYRRLGHCLPHDSAGRPLDPMVFTQFNSPVSAVSRSLVLWLRRSTKHTGCFSSTNFDQHGRINALVIVTNGKTSIRVRACYGVEPVICIGNVRTGRYLPVFAVPGFDQRLHVRRLVDLTDGRATFRTRARYARQPIRPIAGSGLDAPHPPVP